MKHPYTYTFGFFAGALSVFDIGAIQGNNVSSQPRGLIFDMRQLSNDLEALSLDSEKATDRIKQELFGDHFE